MNDEDLRETGLHGNAVSFNRPIPPTGDDVCFSASQFPSVISYLSSLIPHPFLRALRASVLYSPIELLRVGLLGQLHDHLEALRIGDGHVGQDFAVEFDIGLR